MQISWERDVDYDGNPLGYVRIKSDTSITKSRFLAVYINGSQYNIYTVSNPSSNVTRIKIIDFIHAMPNQSSFVVAASLYQSSLANVDDHGTATINIPENSGTVPTITEFSLTGTSLLRNQYVTGLSILQGTANATGKYGATITSIYFELGDGVRYHNPITIGFDTSGTKKITVTVVDSRGFKSSSTKEIEVYSYFPPSISPLEGANWVVVKRADSNGVGSDTGSYIRIEAKKVYSPLGGHNRCALYYRVKTGSTWGNYAALTDFEDPTDTYQGTINYGLDPQSVYVVELFVIDQVDNINTLRRVIPTEQIYMEKSGTRNSLAIGGRVSKDNAFESFNQGYFYEGLHVGNGVQNDKGLLIDSTSGTKTYRITVDDTGNLKAEEVAQTFSLRKR